MMKLYPITAVLFAAAASAAPTTQPADSVPVSERLGDPETADVEIVGHVVEPEQLEPTDAMIAEHVRLPAGFTITTWAEGLRNPRMILPTDDGRVYVTRREVGDCVLLRDADGDGKADGGPVVVAEKPNLHGIALSPDGRAMYLTAIRDLWRAEVNDDGTLGELETVFDDLPDAGQHPNRTMAFGSDGRLYLSVGSTANAADEKNPEQATILQIDTEAGTRRVFARGLRNTIGFGWHPETGVMYGADHGIDWLGDDEQREEFNRIDDGGFYGWPWIYADGKYNPADNPPRGSSMADLAEETTVPELLYTAHSAPLQMTFYTGDSFPSEYANDAFVAMRGSWNRRPPSGYEVVRVRFDDAGEPVAMEPFVTGFLVEKDGGGWGHLGRLAGLAQLPDGSLLLGDDTNGVIYRVAYDGRQARGRSGRMGR